jgi:hypothetical protein
MESDWTGGSGAKWEGLDAPEDVRAALGDLGTAGRTLARVRASRDERWSVSHVDNALNGVFLAANALLASPDIMCDLADPPADVDTRPIGPGGSMVTKCFHKPAHCWDGIGNQIKPCP